MSTPDLNLLIALDALLSEMSVAKAARRLHLSQSAMSRSLLRLRHATGDPLLVRAGRTLVPTPRALELRQQIAPLVHNATSMLRPAAASDISTLSRTFTIRTSEGFVETFGPAILTYLQRDTPGIRLRFVPKPDKDSTPLRDGTVDLETGVITSSTAPELLSHPLFQDGFIGIVRKNHPLSKRPMTRDRYLAAQHIAVSRNQDPHGQIDEALGPAPAIRHVAIIVGGFATAIALARQSDLVATVPNRHTAALHSGMSTFPLPFKSPTIKVSLLWHPRLDADPAHQWLRACISKACANP